jgi:hypothetical protein
VSGTTNAQLRERVGKIMNFLRTGSKTSRKERAEAEAEGGCVPFVWLGAAHALGARLAVAQRRHGDG